MSSMVWSKAITITVGSGFGMSHGQLTTRPFLAQPLFYVKRAHVVDATEAIVTTQRDHGNRTERENARIEIHRADHGPSTASAPRCSRRLPGHRNLPRQGVEIRHRRRPSRLA